MHIRNLTQQLDIAYVIKDTWHLPVHKHTHYELQYIIRGKGQHRINESSYSYEQGDLFILAPQDSHFFVFQERTAICIVKFHESFFGDLLQDQPFRNLLARRATSYRKTPLSGKTREQIAQLMGLVMAEHRKENPYRPLILRNALTLILALTAKDENPDQPPPKNDKIQDILNYIDQHITNRPLLSIPKIADAFHISKGYFNQYFRKATGSSYKKYVQEFALKLIAHQFVSQDKTLSQLAREFGYSDESHLSNAFKAHFHQTPSSLKKEKQKG